MAHKREFKGGSLSKVRGLQGIPAGQKAFKRHHSAAYNGGFVRGAHTRCPIPPEFAFCGVSMFISSAFAQTAPAAAAGGDMQSTLMSMLPLLLMFAVLYFVMIRPQMKKQKEHRSMIDALAKGDEIVTAGGLLGKVSKIGDAYIGVELSAGVEVQLQRSAVVQVLPKGTVK
jgi:preprotein translocase subunit YajC